MSDENNTSHSLSDSDRSAANDFFNAAFLASLGGISGRSVGQDPGSVINEAYVLAERAVERLTTGQPVLTDAERQNAAREAAQGAIDAQPKATASNAMLIGGRFQRPNAP